MSLKDGVRCSAPAFAYERTDQARAEDSFSQTFLFGQETTWQPTCRRRPGRPAVALDRPGNRIGATERVVFRAKPIV
jgi:hypothetical protein